MLRGNNKEKGFTLIELILVIVILGILTAVALPRFINLDNDARVARRQGTLAAFRGAITMLHGQFLINNTVYDAASVLANTELDGATASGSAANAITVNWGDGVETYDYADNGGPATAKATMVCNAGNPC